jgi:hypothetical protein
MKEASNMEPRYAVDITLTQKDIKRFAKMLRGDMKKGYIISALVIVWILYSAWFNLRNGKPTLGIFMIAVVILAPLAFLYASWRQVRKSYQVIRESGGDRYKVLFYDDHFDTKGEKNSSTYEYAKLHGIVETDTDFYLEVERGQAVILQKEKCNAELSSFIRGLKKSIQ